MGHAPQFDEESLRELVRDRWGEVAAVAPCASYRDLVRRVDLADGDRLLLKIAHPDEDLALLDVQIEALRRATAARLPLPRVRPDRRGRVRDVVRDAAGRDCALLALDWIEGDLLASRRERPLAFWRGLGRDLARLGTAWAGLDAPILERDQPWDLGRALFVLDHLSLHHAPEARTLVERAAVQFAGQVLARLDELPAAVIHGDANEHNLLVVGEGDAMRVAGLVDLGDMARTRRVFELAVAAAYAIFDAPDPVAVVAALVAGWTEVAPLEAAEIEALPAAIAMRLAVSVTASARALRRRPDDAYLAVSRDGAWRELARLETIAPADFVDALAAVVGRPRPRGERAAPAELRDRRRRRLGPSLSLSYREPLVILGGRGSWLLDAEGRAHLDTVNNVCHVGHAREEVARAIGAQAHRLNTNTRYLHPLVLDYADRLTARLPAPLEVCYFVNSGSEANELALRLARVATGRRGVLVLDHAYHGNTASMIDISPYKHARRGGAGAPDWVRTAPAPDLFRGRHRAGPAFGPRSDDAEAAARDLYLADLAREADALADDPGLAAFFAESILSCAGQIEPPPGFLGGAAGIVRARGGLWVADEVQVGFGRVGEEWWAFAADGVVPDIVTLGKPIGNGHPLAAVVTTRAVADAFANGMEFFSTFGGNPVSAAAGLAVLDVLERDELPARAARVGARLKADLVALARAHPRVGDVRGRGLFLGLEIVREGADLEPDSALARALVEHARARGVLLSTDGPDDNVIKIKPPLVFGDDEAALLIAVLRSGLESLAP